MRRKGLENNILKQISFMFASFSFVNKRATRGIQLKVKLSRDRNAVTTNTATEIKKVMCCKEPLVAGLITAITNNAPKRYHDQMPTRIEVLARRPRFCLKSSIEAIISNKVLIKSNL